MILITCLCYISGIYPRNQPLSRKTVLTVFYQQYNGMYVICLCSYCLFTSRVKSSLLNKLQHTFFFYMKADMCQDDFKSQQFPHSNFKIRQ